MTMRYRALARPWLNTPVLKTLFKVNNLTSLTLAVRFVPPDMTGGLSFKSSTVTARIVVVFLDGFP